MADFDKIFDKDSNDYSGGFKFDRQVANVFENMISRSVPGYENVITMSGILAEKFVRDNSNCYDLGCSLGATSLSIQKYLKSKNCRIYAVDNSEAMIERLQAILSMSEVLPNPIIPVLANIQDIEMTNNSLTAINFTLQFIKIEERQALLEKIYNSLLPGGVLILSEKIKSDDPTENNLLIDIYHQWKESNGYSKREIEKKREALENVLIPESIETHRKRLEDIGFKNFSIWFRCFNFVSMVAFK
jgi:tRNA (cmo5U34)-methyltransferase